MALLPTLADTLRLHGQWLGLEFTPRRPARIDGGRHLALMAWALPPNSNAGVFRPLSFLRYGPTLGWRIDAFQGEVPGNHSQHGDVLLSQVPPEVRRHVVPEPPWQPSYRLAPRVDGGFKNSLAFARRAIEALKDDPPDAVLASGPPFFVFVAALFTARHFGVPLVLDYRDEWTECPFDFVDKTGQDLWWERRCMRHADALLFVTESLRRHALATFPQLKPERCHHLANGWEPDDFVAGGSEADTPAAPGGPLVLAHVGNLAGHTPPDEFLASLAALIDAQPRWKERLRVRFIGRRGPAADAAVRGFRHPEVLQVIDHVSKREANAQMRQADALLLISVPELDRSLPSKLIDYVAAGTPVLVFGSSGESSELMARLGTGMLCRAGNGTELGRALEATMALDVTAHSQATADWLAAHRRDRLAARLFGLLDQLVRKP